MNLVVEVGQIMFARPVTDLVLVATRSAVAVGATAVGLLQELLVLALQVLLEEDASDLKVRVLVSKTGLFLSKRRVEIGVVVDLPRAADAGVEQLGRLAVSLQRVRIEKVSPFRRQGQSALAVAQINHLDEPLIVEVLKGVVRKIEIVFRHDAERTDGSQRAAVFAVKLVDSIAVNDQFPLVAARQVEVAHQAVARIVFIPVARVVTRAAIRRHDPARRIRVDHPIERQTSLPPCLVLLFGLSVKTPWQFLRGVVQGSAWAPGRFAATFRAWSCGNPGSRPLRRSSL